MDMSISNTLSPTRNFPLQIEVEQQSKSQGCSKCSYIMPTHLKDFEVIKDKEIIN